MDLGFREIIYGLKSFGKETVSDVTWFLKEWWWMIAVIYVTCGLLVFLFIKLKRNWQKDMVTNVSTSSSDSNRSMTRSILVLVVFAILWTAIGPAGILAVLACLLLTGVLVAIAGLVGAESNMWFCYVKDGTIKTVVAGEKFVRFIVNVKGYYYDETDCSIKKATKGEDKVGPFTAFTGLYLVSLLWPIRRIFTFEVLKKRLRSDREKAKTIAEQIDLDKESTPVDHLRWRIERPFFLNEVDMLNNERADFLVKGVFIVELPYKLIFEYGGKFFEMLDSIIIGYTLDVYRGKNFSDIKGTELSIVDLNSTDPTNKFNLRGIVGLIADSITVEEFSLSPVDIKIQGAIQAKKVATLEGEAAIITAQKEAEAAVAKAEGEKKALELVGEGEKLRFTSIAQAIREGGGAGVQAGQAVVRDIWGRHIKDLRGTLVEAGSDVSTTLALSSTHHNDIPEKSTDGPDDGGTTPKDQVPPEQPPLPVKPTNQPTGNKGYKKRRGR